MKESFDREYVAKVARRSAEFLKRPDKADEAAALAMANAPEHATEEDVIAVVKQVLADLRLTR